MKVRSLSRKEVDQTMQPTATLRTTLTSHDGTVTIPSGTTVTVIPMGQPSDHYFALLSPEGQLVEWVRIESQQQEAKRLREAEYDTAYKPWE